MATSNRGSSDWYLSQLAKLSIKKIESKEISPLLKKQLITIKEQYTIYPVGKKYLYTKSITIKTDDIREHLTRLIEVSEAIKEILEDKHAYTPKPINVSGIVTSNLPSMPINNFIHRENVFDQIDKALNTNRQLIITAFAGTGKSSTALEYGHRQQNKLDHSKIVRWFNADSADKLNEAYRNLATELGLTLISEKIDMVRQLVHNKIANLKSPMLFIFDNVEQYYHIKPYITGLRSIPNNQVEIIITSRHNNLNDDLVNIKLAPFNKVDASLYLKKNLGNKITEAEIELLIKTLGTKEGYILPFTLSKAVAYLKENRLTTVKQYAEQINQNKDANAETDLLLKILEKSPVAWQILQYAAHLDPDFISIEIFKELLMLDEDALLEPVNRLESLSLMVLTRKNEENGLQLHRLVQESAIKYANNYPDPSVKTKKLQSKLIVTLNNLFPYVTSMPDEEWQIAETLYLHTVKLLNNKPNAKQAEEADLYAKLGEYSNYVICNFEQSLKYFEEALKIRKTIYQGNHPDIASSLNNVGGAYKTLSDVKKGLQYLEEALKMYQALYQGNHPHIAGSLNNV